jgi:23S rRNA maturation mini-RNase III
MTDSKFHKRLANLKPAIHGAAVHNATFRHHIERYLREEITYPEALEATVLAMIQAKNDAIKALNAVIEKEPPK